MAAFAALFFIPFADAKGRNTRALACISSWRWQQRELVCEGFPSGFGEPSFGT